MNRVSLLLKSATKLVQTSFLARNISYAPVLQIKQIVETRQDNILTIEGIELESERVPYLVKTESPDKCTLCNLGIEVMHTDVLILSQFLRSDGCILPRRITGLCRKQQRKISNLIIMAQKAGLMPNINPSWSNKDPKKRYQHKKYNKYFDESTIKLRRYRQPE